MSTSSAIRLLIADDHVLLTDMLEAHLKKLGPEVQIEKAINLAETLTFANGEASFDLVILDLRMPGMNGLAGMKAVRKHFPGIPIAVMSGEATAENAKNAYDAGAIGFIPKTIGGRAMLNAVQLMLSGERYFPVGLSDAAAAGRPVAAGAALQGIAALTARERDVLRLLVSGSPNGEIGRKLGIETVTVALHLRNIYRKLGVESRTQAVKLCMESGQDI
ncbi:MAG TPA: response regulator transcription factor [Candidatus Sulfotelmatobacter sp.]|nr:response regulator transcription factor [Candidatus Sulfotelmatobacter sp.]